MKILLDALVVSCAVCLYLPDDPSTAGCSACHLDVLEALETARTFFQDTLVVEVVEKTLGDPEPYCQWANKCPKTEGVDYPKTIAQLMVELQIKIIVRSLSDSMTIGTLPCDHCVGSFNKYRTRLYQMADNSSSLFEKFKDNARSYLDCDDTCYQLVKDVVPHYIDEVHKQFNDTREICVKARWCRSM